MRKCFKWLSINSHRTRRHSDLYPTLRPAPPEELGEGKPRRKPRREVKTL